jgi:hypothetical protein
VTPEPAALPVMTPAHVEALKALADAWPFRDEIQISAYEAIDNIRWQANGQTVAVPREEIEELRALKEAVAAMVAHPVIQMLKEIPHG